MGKRALAIDSFKNRVSINVVSSATENTNFRSLYVLEIQLAIPLRRKFHFASLSQLGVMIKADSHIFLVFVSDDVSNSLKATSVSRPSTCARNASRKLLVFISG